MGYQKVTGCVLSVGIRTLRFVLLATCENAGLQSQPRMYGLFA